MVSERIAKWVYCSAAGACIVLAGLWLGVRIQEGLSFRMAKGTGFAVDHFDQSGLDTMIALVERSKSTVDVVATQVVHERFLQALVSAHRRGVVVRVLLDPTSNRSGQGAVAYMMAAGLRQVFLLRSPMQAQMLWVDGEFLVTTNSVWSVRATRQAGPAFLNRGPLVAAKVTPFIENLFSQADAVVGQ